MQKPSTNEHQVQLCPTCGKPKRKGSLTAWIFGRTSECSCPLPNANVMEETKDPINLVVEEEIQQSTEHSIQNLPSQFPDLNLVGQTILGTYLVLEEIGSGGMSIVYKAQHLHMREVVAIKAITPERAFDERDIARLRREAKAACSLQHPNIIVTREFNVDEYGRAFIIMQFAPGETLEKILEHEKTLTPERVVKLALDVAEALAYAHKQGVVHRDIKPSNILAVKNEDGSETFKILDFGIAKNIQQEDLESMKLTRTGDVFGSPLYMSPEQCQAKSVDARTDIYSLGCVLYESLAGHAAFATGSVSATLIMHLTGEPPPLPKIKGTASLERIILRCLEREANDRFPNTNELIESLNSAAVDCQREHPFRLDFSSWGPAEPIRFQTRLKSAMLDAIVVGIIGGLLFLPQAGFLCFQNAGQYMNAAFGNAGSFDLFMSSYVMPTYFLGSLVGFAESLTGVCCIFGILGLIVSLLHEGLQGTSLTYLIFTWIELIALLITNWLYHAIAESSQWQATPGKIICNLKVTSSGGRRISFLQASARHLINCVLAVCVLTVVPALLLGVLGYANGKKPKELLNWIFDLPNTLSNCEIRQKRVAERKSYVFQVAALIAIGVLPPVITWTCGPTMKSVSNAPIHSSSNMSWQESTPFVKVAELVTPALLTNEADASNLLKRTCTAKALESACALKVIRHNDAGEFSSIVGALEATVSDIRLANAIEDGLQPVTITGELHIPTGKQTWASTRYKIVNYEITFLMRKSMSNGIEPSVFDLKEFRTWPYTYSKHKNSN